MAADLVLTIDVGTSSLKMMLFDREGNRLPRAMKRVSYLPLTRADGTCVLDPDRLLQWTLKGLDEFLAQCGPLVPRIRAVGLCTFWHSIMGVGRDGRPVTPLFLWADSRSADEAALLRSQLDEKSYHLRTGCYFHSSYVPAKILWFRRKFPEQASQVRTWMGFGEYVTFKLFGQAPCTHSMASGTGLFNQSTLQWDGEILQSIGIGPTQLPVLTDFVPVEGRWRSPLIPAPLRAADWFPAVGDGATSNVGCSAVQPGIAALMLGTSAALRTLAPSSKPPTVQGLWRYLIDSRRPLIGSAQSNGGIVLQWVKKVFKLPEDWEEALSKARPLSHGLSVLPFLLGERGPEWDKSSAGLIYGLTFEHSPLDIAQAFMEAVCLRMRLIAALITEQVGDLRQLIGTGRALSQSRIWGQMMADALGRPIYISRETEASSRGTALLVLERLGLLSDITSSPARTATVVEPRHEYHAAYTEALQRLKNLRHLADQFQISSTTASA
ncbi:MAG: gluconokinase [Armatimonadetes bacterium]|nr:gluconokinase [Armatimonadota bacterium]MDW8120995.1 gluconokinase [Armatimonadota bacterium]